MTHDIRYVVLSDMHLGQDQSVLTGLDGVSVDPSKQAPMLGLLGDAVTQLVAANQGDTRPTLILLGDILELAFADLHQSSMVFEQFVRSWLRDGQSIFGEVVYIPGNHDHHLWEMGRGSYFQQQVASAKEGQSLPPMPHTSDLTGGLPGAERLIQTLIRRGLGDAADGVAVQMNYPSYVLHNGERLVLCNHGHYFESLYYLMTRLQRMIFPDTPKPTTIEQIERENFGWVDFFWSMLGHQGKVGEDVERVYDILPYPDKLEHLVKNVVDNLIADWSAHGLEKWLVRKGLEKLVEHYFHKMAEGDRKSPSTAFSEAARKTMQEYVGGPLSKQLHEELGRSFDDMTLIFGHTHKPFEAVWDIDGLGKGVKVYNTGGWAVDPARTVQPLHGGAAVLLNSELDAASIHFFTEHERAEDYRVAVHQAGPAGGFAEYITSLVDADASPYRDISREAAGAVKRRFDVLASEVASVDE